MSETDTQPTSFDDEEVPSVGYPNVRKEMDTVNVYTTVGPEGTGLYSKDFGRTQGEYGKLHSKLTEWNWEQKTNHHPAICDWHSAVHLGRDHRVVNLK